MDFMQHTLAVRLMCMEMEIEITELAMPKPMDDKAVPELHGN